jgi:hypothetical protein
MVLPVSLFANSAVNLILCASPPESVVEKKTEQNILGRLQMVRQEKTQQDY